MIQKDLCTKVLVECLKTGGDFAEIFAENSVINTLTMTGGKVNNALTRNVYGAGIRILKEHEEVYGYTSDLSEQGLLLLAETLAASYGSKSVTPKVVLKAKKIEDKHTPKVKPEDVSNETKIKYMTIASEAASAYSKEITQTVSNLLDESREILIVNSDGVYATDNRYILRFGINCIASDGTKMQDAGETIGHNKGYELLEEVDLKTLAQEVAAAAVRILHAEEMVGQTMPVIIHNGFGGVILHEACGHSLEATGVAKGMSVFAGKKGTRIASELVTAVDDGTLKGNIGSENIDDEGNDVKKIVLIDKGILTSYMVDMRNGRRMKEEQTGSTRRQNYRFSPTSRMHNTFIDNGTSTFEEIIADTKYGLFAKKMGGGSVNPVTGEYNFAVLEGYMVRDGKLAEPVRGATLIGNGAQTLLNVDMVANNLTFGHGVCGSISGALHADVGQPTIRVKEMLVGGKGGSN
ncbi:MAG: TldD/PmbA family protein [Erysipelotrichales bacterium]|nr:TldD/PmbA family protein [Erysipelotrichales bacterium]